MRMARDCKPAGPFPAFARRGRVRGPADVDIEATVTERKVVSVVMQKGPGARAPRGRHRGSPWQGWGFET